MMLFKKEIRFDGPGVNKNPSHQLKEQEVFAVLNSLISAMAIDI